MACDILKTRLVRPQVSVGQVKSATRLLTCQIVLIETSPPFSRRLSPLSYRPDIASLGLMGIFQGARAGGLGYLCL